MHSLVIRKKRSRTQTSVEEEGGGGEEEEEVVTTFVAPSTQDFKGFELEGGISTFCEKKRLLGRKGSQLFYKGLREAEADKDMTRAPSWLRSAERWSDFLKRRTLCLVTYRICMERTGLASHLLDKFLRHVIMKFYFSKVPNAFKMIAAGQGHSLAIDHLQKLYSFGSNSDGQLGHHDILYRNTPERVYVLNHVSIVSVAAGYSHSCVIDSQGFVYTFGSGELGKLGHGDLLKRTIPTKIKTLENCVHAACADNHTLVLSENGIVFGFGLNRSGEIGQGQNDDVHFYSTPTKIKLKSGFAVGIATGRNHSLVLDNGVYSFGQNIFQQLGRDVRVGYVPGEVLMKSAHSEKVEIVEMDAGHTHSVLLDREGFVWTFGTGTHGQLGLGPKRSRVGTATRVESLKTKVKQIAAGSSNTYIVFEDNTIVMFGAKLVSDVPGEFVRGVFTPHRTIQLESDIEIEGDEKHKDEEDTQVLSVASGASHTLFVKGTKMYTYGDNELGSCGHNHDTILHRPAILFSCVIPEHTEHFARVDDSYRLDYAKIFSGIQN